MDFAMIGDAEPSIEDGRADPPDRPAAPGIDHGAETSAGGDGPRPPGAGVRALSRRSSSGCPPCAAHRIRRPGPDPRPPGLTHRHRPPRRRRGRDWPLHPERHRPTGGGDAPRRPATTGPPSGRGSPPVTSRTGSPWMVTARPSGSEHHRVDRLDEPPDDGAGRPRQHADREPAALLDETTGHRTMLHGHGHQLGRGGHLHDPVAGHHVALGSRPAAHARRARWATTRAPAGADGRTRRGRGRRGTARSGRSGQFPNGSSLSPEGAVVAVDGVWPVMDSMRSTAAASMGKSLTRSEAERRSRDRSPCAPL